ncbi:MAG: hypothetical protein J7M34_12430 [Anaerolineae bacterium]|nr:hypothetical protein [Anaerolineae bacterium]
MSHVNGNGNHHEYWTGGDRLIQTDLNPLLFVQLQTLQGKSVQGLALWQNSIADEELMELDGDVSPENRIFVDFDLYLEGHVLLEIYAATIYRDLDEAPIMGLDAISQALGDMTEQGTILSDVAMDDEDGLVLVLTTQDGVSLIIAPSGWALGHWDELPDEELLS